MTNGERYINFSRFFGYISSTIPPSIPKEAVTFIVEDNLVRRSIMTFRSLVTPVTALKHFPINMEFLNCVLFLVYDNLMVGHKVPPSKDTLVV